jgi:hypothetical protein
LAASALLAALLAVANALRNPPPPSDFWLWYLQGSSAVCIGLGLVGFALGPVMLNRHLGFLWGVRKPTRIEIAVMVVILAAIYVVVLFGGPSWLVPSSG